MYNILVSGVGAIIGYGIIESLKASKFDCNIIGMDIFSDAYGQYICDSFVQAIPTNDPNYSMFLKDIMSKYAVDLFIPGIEQDVHIISEKEREFDFLAQKVLLNNMDLIRVSSDKYLMYKKLKEIGVKEVGIIPSSVKRNYEVLKEELGETFLLKPRKSYASKGIVKIETLEDFNYWLQKVPAENIMFQKIIGNDSEEYTIGAFGDGEGKLLDMIIFKRRLSAEGATAKAQVCAHHKVLEQAVRELAINFKPVGPTNFQFRLEDNKAFLLEINPRISSSSSLRTKFGYNEIEKSIEYFLEKKKPCKSDIKMGHASRYIADYVVIE